jgi:Uma2 family endonuclease
MAALTQSPAELLTIEEYLRTAYHPDCEFVDGILEGKNMGEREHSVLQAALAAWFFQHRREWNIVVMSEQRTRVSANRVRLPDICLVLKDAPYEGVTLTPPVLALEILSPEDRMNRVMKRLDDFLAMGVKNLWVIDPVEREAFTYSKDGLRIIDGGRLEVAGTPIYLDLPELFASLD